jgi:SRSO17 transposase
MPTPRKLTTPTTEAIDQFCAHFDDLLPRYEERTALRQYLIGLLLPREHNKTLVELGAIVPGADRQRLHHFVHDAPSRRRGAQSPSAGAVAGPPLSGPACAGRAHRR